MGVTGDDPWSILGVTPAASEDEIRSAYARRMRETRPDEDPRQFQSLVEARNCALEIAVRKRKDSIEIHGRDVDLAQTEDWTYAATDIKSMAPQPDRRHSATAGEQPFYPTLAALDRVLESKDLAGWRAAAQTIGETPLAARSSIEEAVILRLNRYATERTPAFYEWPIEEWAFFDLVVQLEAEFAWRQNDRLLYSVLGGSDGERFLALLDWARNAAAWEERAETDSAPRRPLRLSQDDVRWFYDDGQDRKGLRAYRAMAGDPLLFRAHDAATDLFFPHWSLREGRYAAAPVGLLGWIGLFFAYAPWRTETAIALLPGVLPLPHNVPAHLPTFVTFFPLVVSLWIMVGSVTSARDAPKGKRPLLSLTWDGQAFITFPFWAAAQRLYVWAFVGFAAWLAIIYQVIRYPEVLNNVQPDLGFIDAIMLVWTLHFMAGECGQRWLVYKLVRTAKAADRLGIVDPSERSRFMRRRGPRQT